MRRQFAPRRCRETLAALNTPRFHPPRSFKPLSLGPYLLLAALEGLVSAAVLALTALGLSLVFGVMRVVNVAHGEFFMLGAVGAWFAATLAGAHPALGFALALVAAPLGVGLVALLSERLVLRRLGYDAESTIVATIGLGYLFQQAALTLFGPEARPVPKPFPFVIQLPWFGYSAYKLAVIAAALLLLALVWFVMSRTRLGLVMRATREDRETALAFAIPVERVYAGVFAGGAALAAVAAVLVAPISQAHYLMGGDPLLLSFIVVIIGGLGSLRGTLAAALLIGLGDAVLSMLFSPTLARMVATALVAAVLLFRPEGLFGTPAR